MSKVKIKNVKRAVQNFQRSFSERLSQNLAREPKNLIEKEIIATILSGRSPVRGKRWRDYSEKYADRFKQGSRRPVNMLRTGKMLDSLEVKQVRGRPGLLIRFNSPIAIFHDREGAGKSKVIRRLLPRSRERFKDNIQVLIDRLLRSVVRKSTR